MHRFRSKMLENFPDMRWIDIIRDPRGWYCSAKVSHGRNIVKGAIIWNRAAESILYNDRFSDRYLCISFENLIIDRKAVLQKICNFLKINLEVTEEWIQNLKLTKNDGSQWYPNTSYTRNGQELPEEWHKRLSTDYGIMDSLPVYRWKQKLKTWERIGLEILTGFRRKRVEKKIDEQFL